MADSDLNIDRAGRGRLTRVAVAVCVLVFVSFWMVAAALMQAVSPILVMVAFLGYLLVGAILIAMIASRLYRHHKMRKLKFDLANIILITTLLALPFGAANAFWEIFQLQLVDEAQADKALILLMFSAIAAYLLFPVVLLTEALLVWSAKLFTKSKRESHQDYSG